MTMGLQLLFKF